MLDIRSVSSVVLIAAIALGATACGKPSVACRMRQGDAKANLNAVNRAQAKFRETNGHFARSMDELNFVAPDPNFYDVRIVSASTDTYLAQAVGKRKVVAGDEWTIDQRGNPIVVHNACP
jgi:hypothetical protein